MTDKQLTGPLDIVSLRLDNFRSYERLRFRFPSTPGLYFLSGMNEDNPKLGSNGSGKSSLWAGVFWVLFGKSDTGARSPSLVRWGKKKGMAGRVVFKRGKTKVTICRTHSPNTLTSEVEGEDERNVSQEEVDALLGLDYNKALHTTFLMQESATFMDLNSASRTALMEEILPVAMWDEYAQKSADKVRTIEHHLVQLISTKERAAGKLEAVEEDIARVEHETKERKKKLASEVKKRKKTLRLLSKRLREIGTELRKWRRRRSTIEKTVEELDEKKNNVLAALERAKDRWYKEDKRKSKYEVQKERIEKDIESLSSLKGVCPTCKQKVKEGAKALHIRPLKTQLQSLQRKISKVEVEMEGLNQMVNEQTNHAYDLGQRIDEEELKLGVLHNRITNNEREKAAIEVEQKREGAELKQAEEELVKAQKSSSVSLRSVQRKRKALRDTIRRMKARVRMARGHAERLKFWSRTFKDVKLYVVERVMQQLEMEVNNALGKLGMSDWEVRIQTDRETKSKTVERKFHVLVIPPASKKREAVEWSAWSGGEKQRIRLAVQLGLASVIGTQTGINPRMFVLDEPTAGLSREGIEELLQALYEYAHEEKKKVWLIDHHSFQFSGFSATFVATKRNGASTIQQQEEAAE